MTGRLHTFCGDAREKIPQSRGQSSQRLRQCAHNGIVGLAAVGQEGRQGGRPELGRARNGSRIGGGSALVFGSFGSLCLFSVSIMSPSGKELVDELNSPSAFCPLDLLRRTNEVQI